MTELWPLVEAVSEFAARAAEKLRRQSSVASGMEYQIIKSTDADKRHYRVLL